MTASRGSARSIIVWESLAPLLSDQPLDILDIGGGTGGFAVALAAQGHRVQVVDPSLDALAALARRAAEQGVHVVGHQGDLDSLTTEPGSADLILCHGVLEMVSDPDAALDRLHRVLRPGGRLSVLAAQRNAAVLARAMSGGFAEARALLDSTASQGRTGRRFSLDELTGSLERCGFEVDTVHGNRVFADLLPGVVLDSDAGAVNELIELERAVSQRPDFVPIAAQLHLTATRRGE